jgi:hypothetical protein
MSKLGSQALVQGCFGCGRLLQALWKGKRLNLQSVGQCHYSRLFHLQQSVSLVLSVAQRFSETPSNAP